MFDALQQALQSLWPDDSKGPVTLRSLDRMLLLQLPNDIAAFSVLDGHPDENFQASYGEFKRLYRENHRAWDELTLSFVACRSSEDAVNDRFYASLEHDPLFCRKYVIRASEDVGEQRSELLRLPFLPLQTEVDESLQRPQSAQDLLHAAGLSASLARKIVEQGQRSADGIAQDILDGSERLPDSVQQPRSRRVALAKPRAYSRLESLAVEGFRVYKEPQSFDLDASVVVLYGPNGLGKTSFFDAIDYACTGRIGRLCREVRRSQTEFSRLATHLDKTPGSGSIILKGRTNTGESKPKNWTLQRATGNWSTAWLDGEDVDRRTVLNRLTNANWVDSTPRQQNFESLFRATHLFGQDEQELLVEFQKGSVIPEAFISEMLALQDYSQGLTKVTAVQSELTNRRATLDANLTELRAEIESRAASLPSVAAEDADPSLPLEALVALLRAHVTRFSPGNLLVPVSARAEDFRSFLEVIQANLTSIEEQLLLAQSLSAGLAGYGDLLKQGAIAEGLLAKADQEFKQRSTEEQESKDRHRAEQELLSAANGQVLALERRRDDLRTALEEQQQYQRDSERREQLTTEQTEDMALLAKVNDDVQEADVNLKAIEAERANAIRRRDELQSQFDLLRAIKEEFGNFVRDTEALAEINSRLPVAEQQITAAVDSNRLALDQAAETKRARVSLLPEYDHALAGQKELDRLLDSLRPHVHDKHCPLCGSEFKSVDELLERIMALRGRVSQNSETTVRYKTLQAAETEAAAKAKESALNLESARKLLQEFQTQRQAAEDGIKTFRAKYVQMMAEGAGEPTLPALSAREEEVRAAFEEQRNLADTLTRRALEANSAKRDAETQEKVVMERISARQIQSRRIDDVLSGRSIRMDQLLAKHDVKGEDIEPELGKLEIQISAARTHAEQLRISCQAIQDSVEAAAHALAAASVSQQDALASLERVRTSLTEFQTRLGRFGLPENSSLEDVQTLVQNLQVRTKDLQAASERCREIIHAIDARDARLHVAETQARLEELRRSEANLETQIKATAKAMTVCESIERLLKRERQNSIERHIQSYGPVITNIQQRLRSVYGFGGVKLEARGGEAAVQVEWRNKSVKVAPTDFFSDSQKQILMLSIFLAGGLRQNWSGFAPVLLDDPVTHFDDLNAYGFIELIRGILSSHPREWQFFISTCEERLFALMQKKFARPSGGAIFYEFVGMGENGPIVERR